MLYQHQDPTILTKQDVYLRIAYDFSNLGNKLRLTWFFLVQLSTF